jgi:hypothetical protein
LRATEFESYGAREPHGSKAIELKRYGSCLRALENKRFGALEMLGIRNFKKLTKKISKVLWLRPGGMALESVRVFMTLTRFLISTAGSNVSVTKLYRYHRYSGHISLSTCPLSNPVEYFTGPHS